MTTTEMTALTRKLRRHVVTMTSRVGSGHPGGSLSAVEIVTSLYFAVMRHDPNNPQWPGRDRFVLSKGHAAPLLYAVLAESGYFPVDELVTLRQLNSRLQGHTDRRLTAGVEMTSGSLGQGLSVAIGMALAARIDALSLRVHVLLGDGECDEGQVWEAAMSAAHFGVDNLVAIVDRNGLQIDGPTCDIMGLEPFAEKWRAFGWYAIEADGHNFQALLDAFEEAKTVTGQPTVIIAATTKGKGISFMENNLDFHGKAPNTEQLELALRELE